MPFAPSTPAEILDVRGREQQDRLHHQKRAVWTRLGYPEALLDRMRSRVYWDEEAGLAADVDRRYAEMRDPLV
jgi:hypothetical protein